MPATHAFLPLWAALSLAPQDLGAMLGAAVDLPTPERRARAAAELALASNISVDDWLHAMRAFGDFPAPVAGVHVVEAPLWVGARELVATQLHLYVPAGYDASHPAPLLALFHGTGGNGAGLVRMWRELADELGLLLVAPSETGENGGYAFSDRERNAARSAIRWMRRAYNVDENRIHASGVSRGGHIAWDLALRDPHRFASIAPMIGGPRIEAGARNNVRYLENIVHLPIRDLQGARDDPRLVSNLRIAFERLDAWNAADALLVEFPELGHAFELGAVDWKAFFGGAVRDPTPARIVRASARSDEARAAWVEILELDRDAVHEEFVPEVRASKWNGLDEDGRRRYLQQLVDERTARLEVKRGGAPGRFSARGEHVRAFRLLLTDEMLPERGSIEVRFAGRTHRLPAERSLRVLLGEFVERFDRTFLPTAEARVSRP